MDAKELSAYPNLEQYRKQAKDLLKAIKTGNPEALKRIRQNHPRAQSLHKKVREGELTREQAFAQFEARLRTSPLTLADAQLVVAQEHAFESWPKFKSHIEAMANNESSISQFEQAADAIVSGSLARLQRLLRENPELIRARSTREHHSTLLHYVSANGVEDFRQKTPSNIVQITKLLQAAGADVEAISDAYGHSKTLDLVASSMHPAQAGMQIALLETLLDAGAAINGFPDQSVVNGCLANGRPEAAAFLASRGASLDLEGACGVGRLDLVKSFVNDEGSLRAGATKSQMERGFMWACEFGHNDVIEFLLDRGFYIGTNRGMTGLHWALVGGHLDTTQLLVRRGAPLEAENAYGGTALGCAIWAVRSSNPVNRWPESKVDWVALLKTLIDAGAKVYEQDSDFPTGNKRVDKLLRQHGMKP